MAAEMSRDCNQPERLEAQQMAQLEVDREGQVTQRKDVVIRLARPVVDVGRDAHPVERRDELRIVVVEQRPREVGRGVEVQGREGEEEDDSNASPECHGYFGET